MKEKPVVFTLLQLTSILLLILSGSKGTDSEGFITMIDIIPILVITFMQC